jgi:hypothetical protein
MPSIAADEVNDLIGESGGASDSDVVGVVDVEDVE